MKKLLALLAILTATGATLAPPAAAGDEGSLDIGATYYFDAFADLTDRDDADDTPERGFEIRRVYLTVQRSWGDVKFRQTTDIDGKFGTGNLNVYSKYAYLEHKGLVSGAKVLIGQHSPKTHGWVEKRWKYRSVSKTMSDAEKWTQSAEIGVGLQGKAMDEKLEYYLDVNNGNGYKQPVAKDGLGLAARLATQPMDGIWVSGLVTANAGGGFYTYDVDSTTTGAIALDELDLYLEGLAGWEGDAASVYVQYGMFEDAQYEKGGVGANDDLGDRSSVGVSLFGRARLVEKTWALGRWNHVDPDTDANDDARNTFLVGVSHELNEGFFVQPNVEVTSFEGDADTETVARLTIFGTI